MEEVDAIQKFNDEAPRVVTAAARLEIRTDQEYQLAAEFAGYNKAALETIEEERVKQTKPMNEALKATNAFFKRAREPYDQALTMVKAKLAQYQEDCCVREKLAIEAAKACDTHDAILAVSATVNASAPVAGNVQSRTYYEFVIEDESKVPDEFWAVDEKALGAFVRATKGAKVIPGVRVVIRKDVAVGKV
jgi:hypothetical protein